MKILFFLICFFISFNIAFAQSEEYKSELKCDMPNVLMFPFDSINCDKSTLIEKGVVVSNTYDSISIDRGMQQFTIANTIYAVETNTGGAISRFQVPPIYYFIYSDTNNRISNVIFFNSDSCIYREVKSHYDPNGTGVSVFECNYSKPDDCYKKTFLDGKLTKCLVCMPVEYSDSIKNIKEPTIWREKKVILLKEITYDSEGNVLSEKVY